VARAERRRLRPPKRLIGSRQVSTIHEHQGVDEHGVLRSHSHIVRARFSPRPPTLDAATADRDVGTITVRLRWRRAVHRLSRGAHRPRRRLDAVGSELARPVEGPRPSRRLRRSNCAKTRGRLRARHLRVASGDRRCLAPSRSGRRVVAPLALRVVLGSFGLAAAVYAGASLAGAVTPPWWERMENVTPRTIRCSEGVVQFPPRDASRPRSGRQLISGGVGAVGLALVVFAVVGAWPRRSKAPMP
jgi:hypothetical protein